jgi:hypothetical protein
MAAITALNVRLGLDASLFSEGADMARAEVNKVASVLRQSEPPAKKFQKDMELLDRAFSESGRKSKEYAQAVEFLKQKHKQIAPVVKQADSNIRQMTQSMISGVPIIGRFSSALAGPAGAALAAVAALTAGLALMRRELNKSAEEIDQTQKHAAKLGMLSSELVSIRLAAAEFSGMAASAVDNGLQRMTRSVSEAAAGTGAARDAIIELGLSAEELNKAGPAEAFRMIADAMQNTEGESERLRLSFKLFGKEGAALASTLAQGREAIEAVEREAKKLGITLSEDQAKKVEDMNDAFGRSQLAVRGIWNTLTVELAPGMTQVAKLTEDFAVFLREGIDLVGEIAGNANWLADGMEQAVVGARLYLAAISDIRELNFDLKHTKELLLEIEMNSVGMLTPQQQARKALAEAAKAAEEIAEDTDRSAEAYEKQLVNLRAQREELLGNHEIARQMRLEAQGFSEEQIEHLMRVQDENQAIIDDQKRLQEAEEKRISDIEKRKEEAAKQEKMFADEIAEAMKAAQQYFAAQKEVDEKRMAEISKGPGGGMEVGSAAAAKFMADQMNAALGAAAMPEKPTPGEKEIADKARELLLAQRAANEEQRRQSEVMRQQLAELKDNRFSRIR